MPLTLVDHFDKIVSTLAVVGQMAFHRITNIQVLDMAEVRGVNNPLACKKIIRGQYLFIDSVIYYHAAIFFNSVYFSACLHSKYFTHTFSNDDHVLNLLILFVKFEGKKRKLGGIDDILLDFLDEKKFTFEFEIKYLRSLIITLYRCT